MYIHSRYTFMNELCFTPLYVYHTCGVLCISYVLHIREEYTFCIRFTYVLQLSYALHKYRKRFVYVLYTFCIRFTYVLQVKISQTSV